MSLRDARACTSPVIPVYVVVPEDVASSDDHVSFAPGMCLRWWLRKSLCSLALDLKALGADLVVLQDDSHACALTRLCRVRDERPKPVALRLPDLLFWKHRMSFLPQILSVDAVFYNRAYDPPSAEVDTEVWQDLSDMGVLVQEMDGAVMVGPWAILDQGKPYTRFKAFQNVLDAYCGRELPGSLPAPRRLGPLPSELRQWCLGDAVDVARLEPLREATGSLAVGAAGSLLSPAEEGVCQGLAGHWRPGEHNAHKVLAVLVQRMRDARDGDARSHDVNLSEYPTLGARAG